MEIRVNCPDKIHIQRVGKADVNRKLHINPDKNMAHCFRCGFGTKRAKDFCDAYGIQIEETFVVDPNQQADRPTLRLPAEFDSMFSGATGRQALDYLLDRGIERNTIAVYEIGYCETGRYEKRVIIPFYEGDNLAFYQGRDYTGTAEFRYDSPHKSEGIVQNAIFNINRVQKDGLVVITEGPLDALRLPQYAIALAGSGWNDAKKEKLLKRKPSMVLLALDHDDAGAAGNERIRKELTGLVDFIDELPFTSKDLGSISPKELRRASLLCDALVKTKKAVAGESQQDTPKKVLY